MPTSRGTNEQYPGRHIQPSDRSVTRRRHFRRFLRPRLLGRAQLEGGGVDCHPDAHSLWRWRCTRPSQLFEYSRLQNYSDKDELTN